MTQSIQQWLQVAGIMIEIVGIFVFAREWWLGYMHQMALVQLNTKMLDVERIAHGKEMTDFGASGTEYLVGMIRNAIGGNPESLIAVENKVMKRRRRIMLCGVGLVLAGLSLQLIGSWPLRT